MKKVMIGLAVLIICLFVVIDSPIALTKQVPSQKNLIVEGMLIIVDEYGTPRITFAVNPGGAGVMVYDENGKAGIVLLLSERGKLAQVSLLDRSQEIAWTKLIER